MVARNSGRMRLGLLALVALQIVALALALALPPTIGAEEPVAEVDTTQFVLGLVPSEVELPLLDTSHLSGPSLHALPPKVDLSAHLPPIGNQGAQGSCVGWAIGYYYKSFQERIERGWSLAVPEHQFSPAFIYNQRPTRDCSRDGGMSFFAGFTILRDKGAASLAAFPYNVNDTCTQPSAAVLQNAWAYRIESFAPIYQRQGRADIAILKALLAEGKPFAIAVPVYSSFYRITASNPLLHRPADGETFFGGHAMFVVGYDDAMGGFKTANSWGPNWGRDGYTYLSYDFVQYETWEAWVMVDHVAPPAPATVSGTVTLNGAAAPAGTAVSAWVGNTKVAEAPAALHGVATRYTLTVPADNPSTSQREGAAVGEGVSFKLGDLPTHQTTTWQPGASLTVNLSATNPGSVPENPVPATRNVLWLPMARR